MKFTPQGDIDLRNTYAIDNATNLSGTNTGDQTIPNVDDTAYNATSWDNNLDAATKNAIRDKIETLGGGGDVTAASNLTDVKIVQGDGGAKGIKTSTVSVTDVANNTTHRGSDGSDHSKVTANETAISSNTTHRGVNTGNPHSVTKTEVGLGNVEDVDTTNASNITSGTLPSAVLPPIALTSVQTASSEAIMLALTTEEGDVVVRTDEIKSYMHNGGTAGTMADFTLLQTPTDLVLSVFGRTGTIVATADDYTWAQINKATSNIADITTKSHTSLTSIGTNTHAQVDTHLANTSNPHSVNASDVSLGNVSNVATDDTAYNATSWNTNTDAATKNAIRDKVETMDTAISSNTSASHAQSHNVASHSDTTATGAELNTLTDGSDTTLHDHDGISENTSARHTQGTDTALGSGAVAADHGTPATDEIINICYGTGSPPTANTTTIGTLFVKYTA